MTRPGEDTPGIPADVHDFEGKAIVCEVISDVPGEPPAPGMSVVRDGREVHDPSDVEVACGVGSGTHGAGTVRNPSVICGSSVVGDLDAVGGSKVGHEVSDFPAPVDANEVSGPGAGSGRGSAAQGGVEPGHPDFDAADAEARFGSVCSDAAAPAGAGSLVAGRVDPARTVLGGRGAAVFRSAEESSDAAMVDRSVSGGSEAIASSGAGVSSSPPAESGGGDRDSVQRNVVHDAGAVSEDEQRRLAWVYLSRVVQGPCAPLSALIESVGVLEAARAVRDRELPDALRGATRARRDVDRAEADLEVVRRLGGRVVTPDDAEWPAWRMLGLSQLEAGRDPDGAVPLVLWVRGPRSLLEASERALAVVGSRCSTGYGDHVTGDIVGGLAARGWTIVSGAAFGIDAMAHRVALAVGGPTIAVLACGVDRPYPAQHDRLLAEIAETGLVVSEYPPGAVARKHCFLARNRVVAALSDGVLVVEAGMRSGARNTVKWARRIGRPALAVPGPVSSAASAGCHHMIREGEALLVTRAEEVIAEAGPLRLSVPGSATSPTAATAAAAAGRLTGDEATVYTALPGSDSCLPSELAVRTGLATSAVRAALVALELDGLAATDDTGWHRHAPP